MHNEREAYEALEATLNALIPDFRWSGDVNLRLERIAMLLAHLGHPERDYETVHVGGTSGKGSVAAMSAAIMTAHGRRTGLHLSPYVEVLTETWQIDGRYIKPSRVLPVARNIIRAGRPIGDALPQFGSPSYFEAKVAVAFQIFAEEKVDIAVIEVGLGGALDATNVLDAGTKILTNVDLDHMDKLGDTIEEIAADKVQIFKPRSTIVSGVSQPSVKAIVRQRAHEVDSPLYLLDEDVRYDVGPSGELVVQIGEELLPLRVPPSWPAFQYRNAALAVAATRLSLSSFDNDLASSALSAVRLPGRLELVSEGGRQVILDGAHNPEKVRETAKYIRNAFPNRRRVGVVALKEDKDADAVLAELAPTLDAVIFTTFTAGLFGSAPPEDLAGLLAARNFEGTIDCESDSMAAFELALLQTADDDVVVVTGSLYLAGNLRERWFPVDKEISGGSSYQLWHRAGA